eukprot:4624514-Amphidinium_carterae.1
MVARVTWERRAANASPQPMAHKRKVPNDCQLCKERTTFVIPEHKNSDRRLQNIAGNIKATAVVGIEVCWEDPRWCLNKPRYCSPFPEALFLGLRLRAWHGEPAAAGAVPLWTGGLCFRPQW